jgi:chemotaxis protein methyltransferase CheR
MVVTEVNELSKSEYELFRQLVYKQSGINLGEHKMNLVRARLSKRMRVGGFTSFGAYYEYVQNDRSGQELTGLIDAISTNTTHLFREMRHFTLLADCIKGWAADSAWCRNHKTLRIWSAGCSSGEEPYSIAMTVHDTLRQIGKLDAKILATDISTRMLASAQAGRFEAHRLGTVPSQYRSRYFRKVASESGEQIVEATPEIRSLITFGRFNLMTPSFPFKKGFHIIFCRNVMIYFDKPTQEALVGRYAGQLHPGGLLFIGHSESLNSLDHPLHYVEPTVYRKD